MGETGESVRDLGLYELVFMCCSVLVWGHVFVWYSCPLIPCLCVYRSVGVCVCEEPAYRRSQAWWVCPAGRLVTPEVDDDTHLV